MEDREVRSGRSDELNGLRGLAALVVAFLHFSILFPPARWTFFWKASPFSLFTYGHGSVVIFFVLSGFALHRMSLKTGRFGYHAFALRRITRIYGPYLGALALALAGNFWLSRGIRPEFADWFNHTWTVPINHRTVWQHILFLGEYDTRPFNPAFWSLVHEMRISLVFPLLLLIVKHRSAVWFSCVALALLIGGSLLKANGAAPNNLGESLHYAGLFVAGIYISQHQRSLANWFRAQGATFRKLFFIGALALFCYGRFASHLFPFGYGELQDIPAGLAGAALIVVAFASQRCSAFLVSKPIDWLGTRSYSFYLMHGPVLFGLVNLLNISRPSLLLLPLYLALALFSAHVFYVVMERPMVLLSRTFTPSAPTGATAWDALSEAGSETNKSFLER